MTDRLAWHFSYADRRLGYGDGRLIVPGETLRHDGPLVPCKSGLHASEHVADALAYARGPYLWRVRLSGEVPAAGSMGSPALGDLGIVAAKALIALRRTT